MEDVLYNTSMDVQNNAINLNVDNKVCLDPKTILTSQKFSKEGDRKQDLTQESQIGVNGHSENGTKTPTFCETHSLSDIMLQKNSSPTLIESAIKVMKNLFSPEKIKSQPASVLSPINKQRSASGSPTSSIYIPGKSDNINSETGKEILISTTDNNLKIQILHECGGTPSPINFENHNNTDESFLTTVSLIDDSFHSAVTHIDEHAEALKNGANILETVLNNSQNLDLVDSFNDTLENDSYLDNTTLKIGSLTFQNGNIENLNESHENSFLKNSHRNGLEKVEEIKREEKKTNDEGDESQSSASFGEIEKNDSDTNYTVIKKYNGTELDDQVEMTISTTTVILAECCERLPEDLSNALGPSLQEKKCMSERNSPNTKPFKVKLNKSDEILSEGRKRKSSVDRSWNKNTEVPENPKINENFDDCQPDQINPPLITPNPLPLISQQSYTILCQDNNTLKRPMIDENSEKQSFQIEKVSAENGKTFEENTSFKGDDLTNSPQMKQSTPRWEGNNEKVQKLFRPTVLKLCSPEMNNSNVENEIDKALGDSTPIKTSVEISPVNPVNDIKCIYVNQSTSSFDSEKKDITFGDENLKIENDLKNSEEVSNFQKNVSSPNSAPTKQNLNQTFDKTSVSEKNSTFTKKRESMGRENKTFDVLPELNETYAKPRLNETYDKNSANITHLLDRTLECVNNQTFSKGIDLDNLRELKPESLDSSLDGKKNGSLSSGKSCNTSVLSPLTSQLNESQNMGNLSKSPPKIDFNLKSPDIRLDSPIPEGIAGDLQAEEKLLNSLKSEKVGCDPDLVKLIQEQFSPNDIEKICSVVQDMPTMKLSNDILRASEQFDKSFHGSFTDADFKPPEMVLKMEKPVNPLSPQSFDFLNSIRGKPTGRDLSRESLYVKFDPLVQPTANSLIDFTKEGEALPVISASPPKAHNSSICEQLLAISPEKKPDAIVPPLTPLSSKVKSNSGEDKLEKLKELQNEIYFLKNLYSERERANKAKMEDYESQITKLTGESCFLEDKLKASNEREKSLVKKVKEQNQSINQLTVIMEEYVKVISKLTAELETLKKESTKQLESLSAERDSYVTHLQNTEAAFTDVHTKYEKSKKTIVSLKSNEVLCRNTIAKQAQKLEDFKAKAREAQEKAMIEFQKIQEQLNETKSNHAQESARLRAQLRKTELKVEALQESLDQKIKENQQLTAICDELIEGKK